MSATDMALNCRATEAYVTDAADETWLEDDFDYPHTVSIGGTNWTFGWTARATAAHANRNSALDRRLAGGVIASNGTDTIRIDLPSSGNWDLHLASGDPSFAFTSSKIVIKDGSTVKATIGPHTGSAEHFWDAGDTERTSAANWVSNQAALTVNFAGTILNIVLGDGSNYGWLNHIRVVQSGGGGGPSAGFPFMTLFAGQGTL